MDSASPFSADYGRAEREATAAAAAAPEVGMGFHEMFSFWTFVTDVTEHTVQVVSGGGHPSWFPECGRSEVVDRAKFPEHVRYQSVAGDRRYAVDGWAARAEGLTVAQLEQRIRDGKRSPR